MNEWRMVIFSEWNYSEYVKIKINHWFCRYPSWVNKDCSKKLSSQKKFKKSFSRPFHRTNISNHRWSKDTKKTSIHTKSRHNHKALLVVVCIIEITVICPILKISIVYSLLVLCSTTCNIISIIIITLDYYHYCFIIAATTTTTNTTGIYVSKVSERHTNDELLVKFSFELCELIKLFLAYTT